MGKFYITSAIPYVNAKPHIGHALEFVQADTIARWHREHGDEVCLLCGGDENALKNVQAAEKAGKPVQEFIDENNALFQTLTERLHCTYDVWQKGSNTQTHFPSSQKLWELCDAAGDIYKKSYEGLYCVGCETFYTPDELNENGECFEHPGKKLEVVKEENYFFRLSKYQEQLIKLLSDDTIRVIPEMRKNEVLAFLKQPLMDISISRSNERAKNWGVPVPHDSAQRMYVWFDALNIYQSGIGFGWDTATYAKWWPADIHVIGKGISRFHAIYWPAFLLSAKLPLPKAVFVHGYFTVNGQKMSKTLGNVIDPIELVEKYGADALRYYFLREIPPFSDGDFSERRFKELYNADLANSLGNTISRVAKLAENSGLQWNTTMLPEEIFSPTQIAAFAEFRFDQVLSSIWTDDVGALEKHIDEHKPWAIKDLSVLQQVLQQEIDGIRALALKLKPFLPATSEAIRLQFAGPVVHSLSPLFPRLT